MTITLPQLFKDKLLDHNREKGIVYSAIASFEQWFKNSGTPFFRDYTDHGPEHITNVLATAAAMIPTESTDSFSPPDATVFILATLLHDAALHLTEPGFHRLIRGDAREQRITYFDEITWQALWDEFLFTARRWDDQKLADVFGYEFVEQGHSVSDPFERWSNLTLADYKLIGEFIRCHHPRLAHEFAVFGVPGVKSKFLRLPDEVPQEWKDLSGIIARSHGLPLRTCLDYLDAKPYNKRDYQGIHAVYLMALLRLADYLQIDASRAPEVVFQFRVLPSRASKLEWRSHHAVENITPLNEDPESVEINARPPDVETYLRVRDWLRGIQSELDTSWAVLGEVYGRYPEVNFGLHWRRVRSNLDNRIVFADTATYLPRRIRLEVARAELLSLLIRPLYGDDPSFGVRELIQNAVDAVREREYFQEHHPDFDDIALREQEADVTVWLSDFDERAGCAWLEVSDRGIGMTETILTDYFLTAGASYRYTEQWQQTFERLDLPPDGTRPRAQIVRAGRFGVGVLAAFLLGNVIEVETRHISSAVGFRFKTSLTQDAVQVERVRDLPVGTRIRARVSRTAFDKLAKDKPTVSKPGSWDWYVLNTPSVILLKGDEKTRIEQRISLDLKKWWKAETDLPLTIHWRFDRSWSSYYPRLSCNGIFVSNAARLPEIRAEHCGSDKHTVKTPQLHVTDADGILPLGLTRKEIVAEEYGFEHDLFVSIVKDFLARILTEFPESCIPEQIAKILRKSPFLEKRSRKGHTYPAVPDCLLSKHGFCLPFYNSLRECAIELKHILWLTSAETLAKVPDISSWDCIILEQKFMLSDHFDDLARVGIRSIRRTDRKTFVVKENEQVEVEIVSNYKTVTNVPVKEKWVEWTELDYDYSSDDMLKSVRKSVRKKTRWLISSDGMDKSVYPFEALFEKHKENPSEIPFVADFILSKPWKDSIGPTLLDTFWKRLFRNKWIPWKKADRQSKFPKAYRDLAPYLAHYEK